jgi:hypothetical protein
MADCDIRVRGIHVALFISMLNTIYLFSYLFSVYLPVPSVAQIISYILLNDLTIDE